MITNYLSKAVEAYRNWKYRRMMQGIFSDGRPVFTSFGKDIYASDVVNNCIDRIATEISKVNVMSVQTAGYTNVVIPESGYRTSINYGWTGNELVYFDKVIRFWDEKDM